MDDGWYGQGPVDGGRVFFFLLGGCVSWARRNMEHGCLRLGDGT